MSRLDAQGEPSMEEILASIRKIIAEDSPSSRPQPAPQRAPVSSSPTSQRGFMARDGFMRSTPAPAPTARPEPVEERVETYFSPIVPQNAPAPSRVDEPVIAREPARTPKVSDAPSAATPLPDVIAPSAATKPDPAPQELSAMEAEAQSGAGEDTIDAQLVGLLADDLGALDAEAAARSRPDPSESKTAAEEHPNVSPATPASVAPASVSASEVSVAKSGPLAAEASDPFQFDLGPSPFTAQPPTPAPPAPASEISNSLDKLERSISAYGSGGSSEAPRPLQPPSRPVHAAAPTPAEPPAARDPFSVPSVAATLGPYRNLEPLSASFDPPAGGTRTYVSSDQMPREAQAATWTNAPMASQESRRNSALQPSPPLSADVDRALEDTVADLLRPMLKTWLAENMPKIVERALRREINERLLLGRKNAAE